MAKLFVGNISWNADEGQLEDFFAAHGPVTEVKIVYDRETNRSRGFGFVTFEHGTDLASVIKATDGVSLAGRELRVNEAEERPRKTNNREDRPSRGYAR